MLNFLCNPVFRFCRCATEKLSTRFARDLKLFTTSAPHGGAVIEVPFGQMAIPSAPWQAVGPIFCIPPLFFIDLGFLGYRNLLNYNNL
jgi:hypothetical protein